MSDIPVPPAVFFGAIAAVFVALTGAVAAVWKAWREGEKSKVLRRGTKRTAVSLLAVARSLEQHTGVPSVFPPASDSDPPREEMDTDVGIEMTPELVQQIKDYVEFVKSHDALALEKEREKNRGRKLQPDDLTPREASRQVPYLGFHEDALTPTDTGAMRPPPPKKR